MRTKEEILHDLKCCTTGAFCCQDCSYLHSRPDPYACTGLLLEELADFISSLEKPSTCSFGKDVSVKLDGVHELSPHPLKLSQRLKNVTVEILECPKCGETSVGWYRQPNTEEID